MMYEPFMDFTRVEPKPLKERILQSQAFKLTLVTLVVGVFGWAYWYTAVRVNVPPGIIAAVRERDEAFNLNDPNKYLALLSTECDTQVNGEVYTYQMTANWVKWHFATASKSTRETTLKDSFTRSDGRVEVIGSARRTFTVGEKEETRVVEFRSVWHRVAGGWTQDVYRGVTLN